MISVVIPAYNEEKNIARCLESLANQDTKEKFEIIVVDNASTDKTAQVARLYISKINLSIVEEHMKGRGIARSRGFSEAKGDMILSTDADCIVPHNWISAMASTLKNSKSVAVTGGFTVYELPWYRGLLLTTIQGLSAFLYRIYFGHWWLNGFNFVTYSNVYKKSGGFNPKLNVQEDLDLSFKISNLGKIYYAPKIKVLFSGRRFKSGVLSGLKPYLKTFIQFYWKKRQDVILDDPR